MLGHIISKEHLIMQELFIRLPVDFGPGVIEIAQDLGFQNSF